MGLNAITIKNKYLLPLTGSMLECLQGATIFSELDLRNAYQLICIMEGDKWKTTFKTPCRHFNYRLVQFGFTNTPMVFQASVNDVFHDFLGHCVFTYLDNILIFSCTFPNTRNTPGLSCVACSKTASFLKLKNVCFTKKSYYFMVFYHPAQPALSLINSFLKCDHALYSCHYDIITHFYQTYFYQTFFYLLLL